MHFPSQVDARKNANESICWPALSAKPSNKGFIIRLVFFCLFCFLVVVGIFLRRREKQFESQSVMTISRASQCNAFNVLDKINKV